MPIRDNFINHCQRLSLTFGESMLNHTVEIEDGVRNVGNGGIGRNETDEVWRDFA